MMDSGAGLLGPTDLGHTRLPLDVPADTLSAGGELLAAAHARRAYISVLLIEDDDADAYLIEHALHTLPHIREVFRARDGVEALDMIDRQKLRPDLALVDLRMPRKDGMSVLAELDARILANFPAVVLTSSRSPVDVYRAGKRGAWKYLTKQNTIPRMARSLKRIIAAL
ncbi:MAG: response regulator [Sphingobium sp.]